MTTRFDAVQVIESAYAEAADDASWLQGVVEAAKGLDQGLGITAFRLDLDLGGSRKFEVEGFAATVPPEPLQQALITSLHTMPAVFLERALLSHPQVTLASTRVAELFPPLAGLFRLWAQHNFGMDDALGILGMGPEGRGCVLSIPMPAERRVPPRTAALLSRVAAHLASASRLRQSLGGASWRPDDAATEAVLDPDGRLHHLTSSVDLATAKETLSGAVRCTERARGPLRRTDPEEATALWKGLVEGRWSLVDHVDHDGKRFILARRNEPDIRDPKALGSRERHVAVLAAHGHSNKDIGYQLGITPSTVSTHLKTALRKLNLGSRSELVRALGSVA